ncbi:unnamed protein product [Cuscuta epithymum]|uniref:DUF6598 domain-containing protein n=1 Tax=Cuscuta epithymum TaxID=186058 RepID=A0AAV0DU08_9ASTE|nr:unnamed protein product [Cuscuta epithymum]
MNRSLREEKLLAAERESSLGQSQGENTKPENFEVEEARNSEEAGQEEEEGSDLTHMMSDPPGSDALYLRHPRFETGKRIDEFFHGSTWKPLRNESPWDEERESSLGEGQGEYTKPENLEVEDARNSEEAGQEEEGSDLTHMMSDPPGSDALYLRHPRFETGKRIDEFFHGSTWKPLRNESPWDEERESLGEGQGKKTKQRKLDVEEAVNSKKVLDLEHMMKDLHSPDSDWEFYDNHEQEPAHYVDLYSAGEGFFSRKHKPDSCWLHDKCSRYLHNKINDLRLWSRPPRDMFELYRVELVLNSKTTEATFSGELHGTIGLIDKRFEVSNSPQIYYFKVSEADSVPFTLTYHKEYFLVPLSGPQPRPMLAEDDMMGIFFALKIGDKDLFEDGPTFKNTELFGTDDEVTAGCLSYNHMFVSKDPCYPKVIKHVMGGTGSNPITLVAYYSLFFGSWANVDVVLQNGNRVVSSFYGYVFARSCIFDTGTCLLRIGSENKREPIMSDSGQRIPLTRSIVAVPWNSSLVVEAELYDQDGNLIVKGTTSSLATNSPECHGRLIGEGAAFVDFRWGSLDESSINCPGTDFRRGSLDESSINCPGTDFRRGSLDESSIIWADSDYFNI